MENKIEEHPLKPFLPHNTKLLLLGSFPPPRNRWSMEFFYPNFTNDMWRLFGEVFFQDKNYFVEENTKSFSVDRLKSFLTEKGIGIYDTAQEIFRQKGNASDQFLEIVKPVDLKLLLNKIPECIAIVTTGQKATDTFMEITNCSSPKIGSYTDVFYNDKDFRFYRMPSTSRAYPKPLIEKAEVYKTMFKELGIL